MIGWHRRLYLSELIFVTQWLGLASLGVPRKAVADRLAYQLL